MKKTIISLLTISSFIILAPSAYAQRPAEVGTQEQRQLRNTERQSQAIQKIIANITSKLEARSGRYTNFIAKLESRRAKLADQGADLENFDRYLRESKTNLATVNNSINTAKRNLSEIDYELTLGEIRAIVRQEVSTVVTEFNNLHSSIIQAVRALKAASNQ